MKMIQQNIYDINFSIKSDIILSALWLTLCSICINTMSIRKNENLRHCLWLSGDISDNFLLCSLCLGCYFMLIAQ